LITFDRIVGGEIYLKFPDTLEIPINIIQQIQISHNFSESYIITEEKNWNSVSFYNSDKEIVIVLVLDKFDEGNDYLSVLEEFNKDLYKYENESELKEQLERQFQFSLEVFRTRDEVIAKLSNEVAQLKMKVYDLEKRFEKAIKSDHLKVKSRILFLLSIYDELSFKEIKKQVKTSKRWLENVIENLVKNELVEYDSSKHTYYINF
jgi:superfamily II DNA helicase RecQ